MYTKSDILESSTKFCFHKLRPFIYHPFSQSFILAVRKALFSMLLVLLSLHLFSFHPVARHSPSYPPPLFVFVLFRHWVGSTRTKGREFHILLEFVVLTNKKPLIRS